ncbi:maleylpyruvate isomerase N-terminal domain-containing protein [Brevibacterium sp. 'Marine']|uniref:maleylpyruvate isomerase N-terminal domain-containing protein n=1 Tax=Brevibacterium sp. 'Marine' TaxID=2725563 RepID=UPI00145D6DC0
MGSPEDYFREVLSQPGVDAVVLARGVASGEALGPRPADAFASLCDSALATISALSPAAADATIMTIGGGMRAGDYVRTRTFELVVHGIDIAAALGVEPAVLAAALRDSLAIAVELAVQGGTGNAVLAALTGRGGLVGDFSVLG